MNLTLLKTILRTGLAFVVRRYLAKAVFELVIEQAEKLAAKTETNIDDKVVSSLKADRDDFIAALKGRM